MILYMYLAPGQGQTTFWCQQEGFITLVICCKFQNIFSISDFIHIFSWFYTCGSGTDNSQGTKFWCQQKPLVTSIICYKFTKSIWSLILYMYIAPWQGQTIHWEHIFDVNRNILSLRSFVTNLKKDLFEIWFYTHFLMILYMYIAPGHGQTTPWGQDFDVNRKVLSLCPFVASLKKISLNTDFMHIFFMLLYMYIAPWQGLTTPWGHNFDINRTILSLRSFVISFFQ